MKNWWLCIRKNWWF